MPASSFAVWLLVMSGKHAAPFDQHAPTPQFNINTDFLDPEDWVEWCRAMVFTQLAFEYMQLFRYNENEEYTNSMLRSNPKVGSLLNVLDSYPESYPRRPFGHRYLQWEGYPAPNGEPFTPQQTRLLWGEFDKYKQCVFSPKVEDKKLWQRLVHYQGQLIHRHLVVPYITRVELELTPYLILHGEVFN
ncbi:hypothetical protein [Pantanalinema sp. GBBB05]|uniref:hypothetical protein n=1 Tax=Pantanalinema sp. GBBB05 TaxID=2604139 RepID=UPI003D817035